MKKLYAYLGQNLLYVLLFAGIIALNFALSSLSYKIDFSKGKAHTLASSTKSILRNAKGNVLITFFVSESLPSRLIPLKREVDDILSEYQRESGKKIQIERVDPKKDQKKQVLAQEYGIVPISFSQQESDNFAVTSSYFGLGIAHNGKKATIPQATGVEDLEYNISSSIYKLGIKELPKIGLIGVEGLENNLNTFAQVASSQFQLAPVSTPSADIKTLMVFSNEGGLAEHMTNIDTYLNSGGKAIIFAEGVKVAEDGSLTAQKASGQLTGLLRKYGITVGEDLVLSTSADFVNFAPQGSQTQLMVPYPFWLRTNVFDSQLPFFTNINQLSFPWTSSIALSGKAHSLVKTTSQAWVLDKDINLDPQQIKQPTASQIKQINLVAQSTGTKNSEIIVIPSSRFIYDQYMSRESGNLEFVMNVLSEFASGGALAGIRSRSVDYYLIPPMSPSQKNLFKYTNILVLPGIFSVLLAMRIYKRNRQSTGNS